jgi:hypothetical protein
LPYPPFHHRPLFNHVAVDIHHPGAQVPRKGVLLEQLQHVEPAVGQFQIEVIHRLWNDLTVSIKEYTAQLIRQAHLRTLVSTRF